MLDWNECPAVERIPEKVSGSWLFKGTRVPVSALFENLRDGATVNDFLEWFPGVAREQVETVLQYEFLAGVRKGLEQIQQEQVLSHEEVKTWIASGRFLKHS